MDSNQMEQQIRKCYTESLKVKESFFSGSIELVIQVTQVIVKSFQRNGKVLLFGNGGSAADAQHIAAEFVNRFLKNRSALPAVALTTDTSVLTCIGNDVDFESIFSRQVEALGCPGDITIGISTSGNSPNVLKGLITAKENGLITVAFLGNKGGKISKEVDYPLVVPSTSTPRIQETHLTLGHILCELVEETLFPC